MSTISLSESMEGFGIPAGAMRRMAMKQARQRAMRAHYLRMKANQVRGGMQGDDLLLGAKRKAGKGIIAKLRAMTPKQRKAAWKKIPKAKKVILLMTLGPVLIPLLAAAGLAITATAAAAPIAVAMIGRKMRQRRQKIAQAKKDAQNARVVAATSSASGDTQKAAIYTAKAAAKESEVQSEAEALNKEEESLKESGVSPENADVAADTIEPKKPGFTGLIPIAALSALAFI